MNYWGEPDDEPLPDWMDPVKCRMVNEQKELRRQSGKDLNSVIMEALTKPNIPVMIDKPNDD